MSDSQMTQELRSLYEITGDIKDINTVLVQRDRVEKAEKDAARLDWLDSQGYAYGFQDMHEGNRWTIDGPFANVRIAIDAAMEASK